MTKRKDDSNRDPPGGRAAERLREFERARGLKPEQPERDKKPTSSDTNETVSDPHPKGSEKH
jgi:hypothetical protein